MKIKENQEKSDFNRKSLTSIPFGGPIGTPRLIGKAYPEALIPIMPKSMSV